MLVAGGSLRCALARPCNTEARSASTPEVACLAGDELAKDARQRDAAASRLLLEDGEVVVVGREGRPPSSHASDASI